MTIFEPEPPQAVRSTSPVRSTSRRRALVASLLSTVLAITVIFGGLYLVQHPQPILDQITVWQFEPDAAIAAQTERLELTDHGRFLYYASKPEINSGDTFDSVCPARADEEDFGILGCYLPAEKRIHLFDVTDSRLDGTEEVTAAHEILHAAWDRLGADERARLTPLIEAEAEKISDDTEFATRMDYYARVEPGERANELHSIIGTEVAELGGELEEYYAKYFKNRDVVVGLHAAANAVFVSLQEKSEELVASMEALRSEIEADYAAYTSGYEQLNADITDFNAKADSRAFTQEEFDREHAAINRRQAELDTLYATISDRSDQFDAMLVELESLNAETAELQRGLNVGGEVQPEG